MAQPALSQSIRQLEHELGVVLLTRTARGVEPTDAEVTARGYAEERVSAVELAVPFRLAPRTERLLAELRSSDPGVVVRPRQLDLTELLVHLRAGSVDAEMVCPPPPEATDLELQPVSLAVPLIDVDPVLVCVARRDGDRRPAVQDCLMPRNASIEPGHGPRQRPRRQFSSGR